MWKSHSAEGVGVSGGGGRRKVQEHTKINHMKS